MIPIGSYLFAVLRQHETTMLYCRGEWILGPWYKGDEFSVGACWNACKRIHCKQAPTEDATFKNAKGIIAESSLASLAMRGLANYLVFQAASLNQKRVKISSPVSLRQIMSDQAFSCLFSGIQDTRESFPSFFFWGYQPEDHTTVFFAAARRPGADSEAAAKQLKICLSDGTVTSNQYESMRDGVDI